MPARKQTQTADADAGADGAMPAAEAAAAAETAKAKGAEGQAADEEEEEEEEGEEDEEDEEEEEESSAKTESTASWADQRAARRHVGQRKVITRNDWSSDESMFDNKKWRSSEGDSSYVAKSSDEMSVLRESIHSGWMSSTHSGSSDEASDATSNSAAARRKARAAAAEVRRRMHPCERPPCRPFLSASPPFAVAARDFLGFLEEGLLRVGGGPSAPWRTAKASQSGRPIVSKVKHRSAPYALGLREGYLITHVDATPVSWVADLMEYVRNAAAAADAADAATPVADLRFRTTPLQSHESSSEEESDDEEENEASSGDDAADGAASAPPPPPTQAGRRGGKGKGKGGAKLPVCLKPAAKRGGPNSQTTWRAAQAWQQARLREGEEVAEETHDVLRDIMEKMKAAEERRAAARHALRKGRRLQGAVTVAVHRDGGTMLAFRGHPQHLTPARTLAVTPGGAGGVLRQTQGAWAGVKRAKRRRGSRPAYAVETDLARNVFRYRDPVTGLGYSTAEEFAALRKSAVVAARFLQSTVTGEAAAPVDDVLRGGVPHDAPLAPVVAAAMAKDGVGPSVWRRQVGKFAAFSFLRLYGQSGDADSAVPASKRARRGAD